MAAMTLAVGVAYREIYSWKTAILYRRLVCQGTPSFVALEKTGFFKESARAAYTPPGRPLLSSCLPCSTL